MVTIHFERFSLGTMRTLHARRTRSYRGLRGDFFHNHELDIPWDSNISPIFSGENLILADACAFLDLLRLICYRGQFHFHYLGSYLMHDCRYHDHHHGPIEMLCARRLFRSIRTCSTFVIFHSPEINAMKTSLVIFYSIF